MTGTCLKSQDSSLQVGGHGCHALISDRNVFKESDSSLQVGVHGCQALISDRNVFKESGFIVASWGTWLLRFN